MPPTEPSVAPEMTQPARPAVAWEKTGEAVTTGPAVRLAVVEADGLRVSLEIERSPVPADEPMWVTTTVENTGREVLHWMTDGCGIHMDVRAEFPLRWAPGQHQTDERFTFKEWALHVDPGREVPITMEFIPESLIGRDVGCADVGIGQELAPGEAVRQRARWDGQAVFGFGPPPSGPATLRGFFRSWWHGAVEPPESQELEVRLPIEVVGGRDPRFLSPGQAIDVALRVPALRALLARYPRVQDWVGPIRLAVNDGAMWEVGLKGGDGSSVTVVVDPIGAVVVDVVEVP